MIKPYSTETGIVAPLDVVNVDTDQIIPKQFLKKIERTGFGEFLFFDWRYNNDGTPNPDFILNHDRYKGATILLTRDNFGSGSSREHAPWALKEYGFRTIIAPSFADIFYTNCFKNSMLLIELDTETIDDLFNTVTVTENYRLKIDLKNQKIYDDFGKTLNFEIDNFKKEMLLKGIDEINQTLLLEKHIRQHEEIIRQKESWRLPRSL